MAERAPQSRAPESPLSVTAVAGSAGGTESGAGAPCIAALGVLPRRARLPVILFATGLIAASLLGQRERTSPPVSPPVTATLPAQPAETPAEREAPPVAPEKDTTAAAPAVASLPPIPTAKPKPPEPIRGETAMLLARATKGDPMAQFEIALRYATGSGIKRDDSRAAAWFREAAINGVAAAQYDLAVLYETGRGLAADPLEALIWYQSAADQNDAAAQYRLGVIALQGHGIPSNSGDAVRWFRKAAEQGVAAASLALAQLYERGDGVEASPREAYAWGKLAMAAGDAAAASLVGRVGDGLDPEKLAEAEARATALSARLAGVAAPESPGPDGLLHAETAHPEGAAPSRGMVSEIQRLLAGADYDPGPADGRIGEQTVQAIRRYQEKSGIAVDGVPDMKLLAHLRAATAPPPPVKP